MNTICKMRDIYKALSIFETAFEEVYGISLNEAMVLCALREAGKEITSPNERKWLRRIRRKSSVR